MHAFNETRELLSTYGPSAVANAVLVQPDGKIIVIGQGGPYPSYDDAGILARYNRDGSLDASFGTSGRVIGNFKGRFDGYSAGVLQSDGKIVVTGQASDVDWDQPPPREVEWTFALARFNPDGSVDETFGQAGLVLTSFRPADQPKETFRWNARSEALARQVDGKLVVAGSFGGWREQGTALARYAADGALDPSFDRDGRWVAPPAERLGPAMSVIVLGDGRIVTTEEVGSRRTSANGESRWMPGFLLRCYRPDGSPDQAFGSAGLLEVRVGDAGNALIAIAPQPDGNLIVVGRAAWLVSEPARGPAETRSEAFAVRVLTN
jgi:uncharacterized delta-60 repeat protein